MRPAAAAAAAAIAQLHHYILLPTPSCYPPLRQNPCMSPLDDMTKTATSPRYQTHRTPQYPSASHPTRSTTTPTANPAMTPFLSPRLRQAPQSPNYFAFQAADSTSFMSDSPNPHTKSNWSPPSSAVRSTAAASPSIVPLDQSPDYEAFRKQSEGKSFSLNGLTHCNPNTSGGASTRSRPSNSRTTSRASGQEAYNPITNPKDAPSASHRTILESTPSELSQSPKRMSSPGLQPESKRRASPPTFDGMQQDLSNARPATPKTSGSNSHPRLQLPLDSSVTGSYNSQKARAETLPTSNSATSDEQLFVTPQHVINLIDSKTDELLLLDLRVQTQYANAHISSALNLCIPTTLLKRPSFNVQKLAETFKDDNQRARFENWENSSYIIVYDGNSSLLKDATICLNTIKKFRGEGYNGTLYIIKGGFNEFAKRFPQHVERGADVSSSISGGVDSDGPEIAPVIGGCPMPSTDKPANPFFGNIRQNMDLIGGVGQITLKHPSRETSSAEEEYPEWLKVAADKRDQGKKVSTRFEAIERREKKRMEDALSGKVSFGSPKHEERGSIGSIRIAGIEKGNKNRYNNIWPFEHSRVRLQGVPSHGCDYFNANHIKASWSNKRYISTQAPIPATFNDFWNVVWQQDVRVVVMLTAEMEGAQVKAHKYWDQKRYGPIHLDFLSEKRASLEPSRIHKHQRRPMQRRQTKSQNPGIPLAQLDSKEEKNDKAGAADHPYVIVRKFTISHDRFPFEPMREITQLQYSSWPDFGAPAHPAHLLGLVEQTNAVVRATDRSRTIDPQASDERPILVHCSAGCGRTGTFCTVDSVIDMLKRQRLSKSSKDHSPMDIDTPPRRPSEGGFFASQYQDSGGNINGAWLQRQDQDLVEKTVEDFRHQRISMVQSLRQYVLCYESVMEWLVDERENEKEHE